jgi:hypothetical protein
MIHNELQFTLSVAFHYVLHRNESLGIPCKTLARARSMMEEESEIISIKEFPSYHLVNHLIAS